MRESSFDRSTGNPDERDGDFFGGDVEEHRSDDAAVRVAHDSPRPSPTDVLGTSTQGSIELATPLLGGRVQQWGQIALQPRARFGDGEPGLAQTQRRVADCVTYLVKVNDEVGRCRDPDIRVRRYRFDEWCHGLLVPRDEGIGTTSRCLGYQPSVLHERRVTVECPWRQSFNDPRADDVTLRISLTVPASVSPGQTLSLSGTATLQFPEKAYQEGKQIGETEADGYSNTLSIASTVNGRTTDVPANRWQTAPFPWRDPVVISAPITIKSFTVPANASGAITITLPRNQRAAPNTASSNPATVAFNGVANNKTAAGNVPENLGCYIQGGAPSVMGSIPISAAGGTSGTRTTSGTSGTPGGTTGTTGGGTTTGSTGGGTTAGTAGMGTGATTDGNSSTAGTAGGGTAQQLTVGGSNSAPVVGSNAPTGAYQVGYAAPQTRSGVFISTNVLIVGGALICLAALAYAALTGYRLRTIKKAMDG